MSLINRKFKGYSFTLTDSLRPVALEGEALQRIVDLLEGRSSKNNAGKGVLSGRGDVFFTEVEGFGPIVIKNYNRGGVLGKLIKRYYCGVGKKRPQVEFEILSEVREKGVSAPEPLGFVTKGGVIYRGALILKEIEEHENLAELSLSEGGEEKAEGVMKEFTKYVSLLIEEGIRHVDLHPGNVLIDSGGKVFLIDFDKAHHFTGTKNKLRDYYLCRWRRAVLKHNLPEFLSELMCIGIRRNYV